MSKNYQVLAVFGADVIVTSKTEVKHV